MEFNEEEAIKYIIDALGADAGKIDEDEILNVIDIIWDYYDDNGLLDIDCGDDDEVNVDDLITYVKKVTAKDKHCPFSPEETERIVRAELEYESKTIG